MRKLTAGIFSVLLGLVSVGGANAAVVSTEYLDEVLEDVQTKMTANGPVKIVDNVISVDTGAVSETGTNLVTAADINTAINSVVGTAKTELQTNIDAKVAQDVYNTHLTNQAAIDAKQTEDITKNTNAITILNGDENTTGSVKNEIKVLSDLLGSTSGDVSGLATQVGANTTAIEKLNASAATTDSVRYWIGESLGNLDKSDESAENQFVTAVSQENGVITVSRRALAAADIPTVSIEKVEGLQDALNARQVKLTNTDGAIVISQEGVISIAAQGITSTMIKDEAIVEAKLAAESVTSTKIKNGAITNEKLGAQAVKGTNIENKAVGATQLADDVNSLLTGAIQAPTSNNAEGTFVLTAKKNTGTDGKVTYEYAWEDIAGRDE